MKQRIVVSLATLVLLGSPCRIGAQGSSEEAKVRRTVQLFYDALNTHKFDRAPEYTTEDWINIAPFGRVLRGRDAVLKELERSHSTFLKDVTVTIEQMGVRFADPNVAVVDVTAHASPFTGGDGVKRESERRIRVFIVVKRNGQWLIMQDQSTTITRG